MVGLTAENFETVETHAGKVAQLLHEVAEASNEQTQGIGQINHSMLNMDQITQSNASSANESARAAGSLSSQAAGLLEAVNGLTRLVHGPSAPRSETGAAPSGRTRRLISSSDWKK
jgi:Methyl-accepting chemotaxis protein